MLDNSELLPSTSEVVVPANQEKILYSNSQKLKVYGEQLSLSARLSCMQKEVYCIIFKFESGCVKESSTRYGVRKALVEPWSLFPSLKNSANIQLSSPNGTSRTMARHHASSMRPSLQTLQPRIQTAVHASSQVCVCVPLSRSSFYSIYFTTANLGETSNRSNYNQI